VSRAGGDTGRRRGGKMDPGDALGDVVKIGLDLEFIEPG
jgi:hypothetical protein